MRATIGTTHRDWLRAEGTVDGKAYIPATFVWALGFMMVVGAVGCGRQPVPPDEQWDSLHRKVDELQSQIGSLEQAIERLDRERSYDAALAGARERMDSHDYLGAHDYLLAALRTGTSDPEVFNTAVRFVRKAAKSKDGDHVDLAQSMFARTDALIPFQAVERIAGAREAYRELENELAELFARQESLDGNPPIDKLAADVEFVQNANLPPEISLLILDQLQAEFETLTVQTARDGLVTPDDILKKWGETKTKLEAAQHGILGSDYAGVHQRVVAWTAETETALNDHSKAGNSDLQSAKARISELIQKGDSLVTECLGYALIEEARGDQQAVNRRSELLERTREWIDNQLALAQIMDAEANKESSKSLEVLKRLAEHDSQRLAPYIYQRYEEVWQKWFDELKSDDEKVEATKLRVMRGLTP